MCPTRQQLVFLRSILLNNSLKLLREMNQADGFTMRFRGLMTMLESVFRMLELHENNWEILVDSDKVGYQKFVDMVYGRFELNYRTVLEFATMPQLNQFIEVRDGFMDKYRYTAADIVLK